MTDLARTPLPVEGAAWLGAQAWAAALVGLTLLIGTGVSGLGSAVPFPALAEGPPAAPTPPAAEPRPRPQAAPGPAALAKVNLNRADAATLQTLPGIGPVLAARIIAHRGAHGSFRQTADLLDVPGIGPKRFAQLSALISVGEGP